MDSDFTIVKDYKDSVQKINKCEESVNQELEIEYQAIMQELEQGNIEVGAYVILKKKFDLLKGYKDSYQKAAEMRELIKKDELYEKFKSEGLSAYDEKLTGWRDSDNLLEKYKENQKKDLQKQKIETIGTTIKLIAYFLFFVLLIIMIIMLSR